MNRPIARGISCGVPVFPPAPAIRVSIDGRIVVQYARPFVWRGRVYAPGALLGALADRAWRDGDGLIVVRGVRRLRVRPAFGWLGDPNTAYFAAAAALRTLGVDVSYVAAAHLLQIRTPQGRSVANPTPFRAPGIGLPQRAVFTPEPVPTPRPVWTGSPVPRRTPLPFPPG